MAATKTPKDRIFTQRLKDKLMTEMARQGLNGQRLAQRSQVSDSEISRICSGQSTPGLENAFRLARALSVSVDYLADDTLDRDPKTVGTTESVSPEERQVLDVAQRLGLMRAALLLENISFVGYETAMKRLLGAKPVIEIDHGDDATTRVVTSPAATGPVTRSNSA